MSGRKIRAKPTALAARGCTLDTDGDGNCPMHPNGCPIDALARAKTQDHITRLVDAGLALASLEQATKLASDARTRIVSIVGPQHHAAISAAQTVSHAMKAEQGARQVLAALKR